MFKNKKLKMKIHKKNHWSKNNEF